MGILRRWYGMESEKITRRKLRNGFVVEAYGGTFVAKVTPIGGVSERCRTGIEVDDTWETKYRTTDEYIASLYEAAS